MIKFYLGLFILLTFCASQRLSAQPLIAGDLAVLGFNSDQSTDLDGDGFQDASWAIVTLRPLAIGTIIHFTDAGITQDGTFNVNANNEGHLTWTITTLVPAGKVFAMDCVDGSNFADLNGAAPGNGGLTDYGSVSGHLGGTTVGVNVPFSTSGDQIIIYRGTVSTTVGATFIYGYNTQQNGALLSPVGVWQTAGVVSAQQQSYLPAGLTNGTTAVALTTNVPNTYSGLGTLGTPNYGFDNMIYGGIRVGTRAQLLAAIGNPANHIGNNDTPFPIGIGGSFSIPSDFVVTDVLPLTWGNITGSLQKGNAILQWETIQETNSSHFNIETSINGVGYTLLKSDIAAEGHSNQPHSYQYSFPTGLSQIYVRIKQVDIDGRFSYSKVLLLKDEKIGNPTVVNNPVANGQLLLSFPLQWQNTTYSIFSTNGSLIKTGSLKGNNGGQKKIDIGDILPGIYNIVISGANKKISLSFIKL